VGRNESLHRSEKIVPPKYKAFVKDHDFVEYDMKNQTLFFDPTLYDLLGERVVRIEEK
jgi:predicted protein tyrosine phosphatase